jgi:hypothetical protein
VTTIVWREWFNEAAVKQLTEMGTLPRNEINLEYYDNYEGEHIAEMIAQACNKEDVTAFTEPTEIVILEPEKFAGTYEVYVDFEPRYTAERRDD